MIVSGELAWPGKWRFQGVFPKSLPGSKLLVLSPWGKLLRMDKPTEDIQVANDALKLGPPSLRRVEYELTADDVRAYNKFVYQEAAKKSLTPHGVFSRICLL